MTHVNTTISDVLQDIRQTRIALFAHTNEIDLIVVSFEKRNIYFCLLPEVKELITYAHNLKERLLQ